MTRTPILPCTDGHIDIVVEVGKFLDMMMTLLHKRENEKEIFKFQANIFQEFGDILIGRAETNSQADIETQLTN